MKGKMMEYINWGLVLFGALGMCALLIAYSIVSERESAGVSTAKSSALAAEILSKEANLLSKSNLQTIEGVSSRLASLTKSIEDVSKNQTKLYDEVGPLIIMKDKVQALTEKYNGLHEQISKKRTVIRIEQTPVPKGQGMDALLKPKGKKSKEVSR